MEHRNWPKGWNNEVTLRRNITLTSSEKYLGKGSFLYAYACTLSGGSEHHNEEKAVLKWGIIVNQDAAKKVRELMRGWEKIPENDNVLELIYGEVNSSPPLRMFYVTRQMECNLQEFILQNDNCTYKDILTIFEQICSGLKHLHAQNSFYHYLKPTNVMISIGENHSIVAKISRFSLTMVGDLRYRDTTLAKKVVENTSPPEAAAKSAFNVPKQTWGADIFSFGVLMWIVLNRKIVHEEDSCQRQVGRPIKWPLVSGREYTKWCQAPRELCDLVESCLSYECPTRSSDEQGRPSLEEISNQISEIIGKKWTGNRADAYYEV